VLHALLIRKPWLDKILNGSKTWEIRGSRTTKNGRIGLIESGSGKVVGVAELVDVVGPMSLAAFRANRRKVGLQKGQHFSRLPYPRTFAWVLQIPERLKRPVPYKHPYGAVIWVCLKPRVERAVLEQIGVRRTN
jgi:hypothetical protein